MNDRPVPPGLAPYWTGPVSVLADVPAIAFDGGMKERHRIFSLLLMSITVSRWNGNKYGETGDYGAWRERQELVGLPDGTKVYQGGTYLGHNIAALAVDGEGHVIDFDFNHNDVFDSSVEHAESRLVRRVFSLNQVFDPRTPVAGGAALSRPRQRRQVFATATTARAVEATPADSILPYNTLLSDVTIYTSLESCAQCSGIMCLASVKDIVYLQWDQGQFLVGNVMYNATQAEKQGFLAPRPVRGDSFDFEYFGQLNDANDAFTAGVAAAPFYRSGTKVVSAPSVTSFLCTDAAFAIYEAAATEFGQWTTAAFPEYVPADAPPSSLTNQQALDGAREFLTYASELKNRGTPHRV